MSYFPDEAALIERMYGLLCNSSDLKNSGLDWKDGVPKPRGLSQSPDSVQWRQVFSHVREEYHNWLGWYCFTHPTATEDVYDPDAEPTNADLIESLKLVCPCGECNGAWISRDEANLIIERLKGIAVQERDSGTAG